MLHELPSCKNETSVPNTSLVIEISFFVMLPLMFLWNAWDDDLLHALVLVKSAHADTTLLPKISYCMPRRTLPFGSQPLVPNRMYLPQGEPTVPSLLGEEKATNPFLRPHDLALRKHMGFDVDAEDWQVFAAVRAAKDRF